MESYLFADVEAAADTMVVEGYHKPGSLTRSSGAWIHAAGTAMFEAGRRPIKPHDQWIWFAVEAGEATLVWQGHELTLKQQETCFLPAGNRDAALQIDESVRCVWIALEGPLAPMVVRKMGALLHMPLKQGALPSQMYLAKQIVQVIVRHTDTSDATYQLQHLMYGMLASHWGQPVAMDAMLSHEIAKVVDTLRANQYKDNFSLAEMAAISRMPMETFRKRFVSEVGNALDLFGICEQLAEVGDALLELVIFVLQLLALETLQGLEAHIEDGLRLHLGEAEALHEVFLGVVIALADDADDLVNVLLGDEQTLKQMRALERFLEVELRAPDDDLLLEGEILVEDVPQGQDLRLRLVVDQREHIHGERGLHLRLGEEAVEHDLRVGVLLELDDDAHTVAVGLVAQTGPNGQPSLSHPNFVQNGNRIYLIYPYNQILLILNHQDWHHHRYRP